VDVPVLNFLPLDPGRDELTDALAVAAAYAGEPSPPDGIL
jgi:hypothetical protein